jgi:hypothetical protein
MTGATSVNPLSESFNQLSEAAGFQLKSNDQA